VGNHGGLMSAHLGLVLHVQQGNNGLSGWFNNPTSQASSTWWVSKTGALEQYVDADVCAWAQGNGNSTYNSVETEGYDTEALTAAAEDMLAQLYAWGAEVYGWPPICAESPGGAGFGWHGMGGSDWGGHYDCPGSLRKDRRPNILASASGPTPTPPPEQEDDVLVKFDIANGSYVSDGVSYRWIIDEWDLNALRTAWPTMKDLGAVNGFKGFGVPADATTASLSGQQWTDGGPAGPANP
jgi:hypothetical protein